MKKSIIWFVVISLIVSIFMGCASSKKKKSPTGPDVCPEDFNFYLAVSRQDYFSRDDNYMVMLQSYTGADITSAILTVNGVEYPMQYNYGSLIAYITLDGMEAVSWELEINGEDSYSFNLAPVPQLTVEWPEEIEFGLGFSVGWELNPNQNPEYQEISCALYSEMEEGYFDYEVLGGSTRSFNVPNSWVPDGYYSYSYDLIAANYVMDGELLVMAIEVSYQYYGLWGKSPDNVMDKVREIAPRLK